MGVDYEPSLPKGPGQVDLEQTTTHDQGDMEDADLSMLGLDAKTVRDISLMTIIACGWNICVSWWYVTSCSVCTDELTTSTELPSTLACT